MTWWAMPLGFIGDMADLAAKIEADERLGVLMDTAAATGNMKKRSHRQHIRDLRRQAMGPSRRRDPEPLTRSEAPAASVEVASFGIEIVYVDPSGKESHTPPAPVIVDG